MKTEEQLLHQLASLCASKECCLQELRQKLAKSELPEEAQERIFERFYRVDKSHSREIGGTGLGLAITRSSIQMHHGVIKVYSKEGEGTTFSVRIPLSYIP